jgi:hypothetical protein
MGKLKCILSAARIQFPLASLHLMNINALKSHGISDYGWNGKIRTSNSIMGELKYRTEMIRDNASHSLIKPPPPQAILVTDAAEPGWGAELTLISAPSLIQRSVPNSIHPLAQQYNPKSTLLNVNFPLMAYGRWKENMNHQSSRRELVTIHQA